MVTASSKKLYLILSSVSFDIDPINSTISLLPTLFDFQTLLSGLVILFNILPIVNKGYLSNELCLIVSIGS